jgi:4-nitrophenyl phosphatase
MKQYKAYCFDLDGTVYRGKEPIPSAISFIHSLQEQEIEPYYITNNSSKTREQLQQALANVGVIAPLEHIYSSALVTARYIRDHFGHAKVYVIGSEGIRKALEQENIVVAEEADEHVDVLVMGIDRQITYDKIAQACRIVQNGAKLIGTNEDLKFPSEQYFYPGCGSFVQLVANVSNVEFITIGKPSSAMLDLVQKEHKLNKKEMVMIGDNYNTDIVCGIQFGCDTIHVNTGVTPTEKLELMNVQPTYKLNHLIQTK